MSDRLTLCHVTARSVSFAYMGIQMASTTGQRRRLRYTIQMMCLSEELLQKGRLGALKSE